MLKRILIILPLIFSLLHGIVCIGADGRALDLESRQYHYFLHNSSNDFSFFGANRWGVRFNFRTAYPGMEEVSFRAEGARLWFPIPGDSVTVELCLDSAGEPGMPLTSKRVAVSQNLIDLQFDEAISAELIWMMVSYRTNMQNRFVAASNGDGTNSYYMNQVGDLQYLSNMAQTGFPCELLFGILGEFEFDEVDLRLQSFALEGDLLPGEVVYPKFEIYNHSDEMITGASLEVKLSRPGLPQYESIEIQIPQALAPHQAYEFDQADGFMPQIHLPAQPCQLRVEALLQSEFVEDDLHLSNNQKLINYEIFSDESPLHLLENFLRQDESAVISSVQGPYLSPAIHAVNYYPILSDSLANLASRQRFNWYGFNSIPRTVGDGSGRIIGFTDQYETRLQDILHGFEQNRSFISGSNCVVRSQQGSENISVDIELFNDNTSLYTAQAQSLMGRSRLFAGLFAKHDLDGVPTYSLSRWIAFADTVNSPLDEGSSVLKEYSFGATGLTEQELAENHLIYYWVQMGGGGKLYYADYFSFEQEGTVALSDAELPSPRLRVYPNPVRGKETLKIKCDGAAKLSIYNLRGQRIYHNQDFQNQQELPLSIFPASGIYFVRIQSRDKTVIKRKISILK